MSQETSVATADMGDSLRCGLCLEKLTSDTNAKQLPCSHVYCSPCLKSDEEKICPTCRQSWIEVSVDELGPFRPTAGEDNPFTRGVSCDLCRSTSATAYCVNCMKSFCEQHEVKHDELFDLEHDKVSVSTYMRSPARFRSMKCTEHSSQITVTCELCHLVFCGQCDFNTECRQNWKVESVGSNPTPPMKHIARSVDNRFGFPALTKTAHGYKVYEGTFGWDQHTPTSFSKGLLNSVCGNRMTFSGASTRTVTTPLANLSPHRLLKNSELVFPNHTEEIPQTTNSCMNTKSETSKSNSKQQSHAEEVEETGSQIVKSEPILRGQYKRVHQLVAITDFTVQTVEELNKHLENISQQRTNICKAEKNAWREVDATETRAEKLKGHVDDIIRKKIECLVTMGDSFKAEIDRYSTWIAEEAVNFMIVQEAKDLQLAETEKRLSETLAKETHVTGLTDLLHTTSFETTPTAEFVVKQKSIQFSDWGSKFQLKPFSPSSLEFCRRYLTDEEITALCAMSDGNIVVSTNSNILEVRNMRFKLLFREKVPGQLKDVVATRNAIVCLLKDEDRSIIYRYSSQLKKAKKLCSWYTTKSSKNHLAASGSNITVCKDDNSLWNINEDDGEVTRIMGKNSIKIKSLCATEEGIIVGVSAFGIERFSHQEKKLLYSWSKLSKNDRNNMDTLTSSSIQSVFAELHSLLNDTAENVGLLSKTRDSSDFFYACKANTILALSGDGTQAFRLTHLELSNIKNVTAIAISGNQLVVGCGREGLKLFSVV